MKNRRQETGGTEQVMLRLRGAGEPGESPEGQPSAAAAIIESRPIGQSFEGGAPRDKVMGKLENLLFTSPRSHSLWIHFYLYRASY